MTARECTPGVPQQQLVQTEGGAQRPMVVVALQMSGLVGQRTVDEWGDC